jgi:hypothetical protein
MVTWLNKLNKLDTRTGYFLLLTVMLNIFAVTACSQPAKDSQLAIIEFDFETQLQAANQTGIKILHYLPDRMIAIISSEQEKWLQENKFRVQIVDLQLKSDSSLYLVQSFIPAAGKSSAEYRLQQLTDITALSNLGLIYEYKPGTYLLNTELENISKLKNRGYEVLSLQGKTYLPWITPPPRIQQSPAAHQLIQSLITQVSWSNLSSQILYLQDNDTVAGWDRFGSRYSFYTTLWESKAEYIATTFQSFGLTTYNQYFQHNGYTLRNIIAVQPGLDASGYYILSAHYDSYSNVTPLHIPAPGADDNASGTSAVIEVARILSSVTTKYPIRYITFGAEEQMGYGWSGAYAYASTAFYNSDSIFGVINLDMIGWDWLDQNKAMSIGNTTSEWIVDAIVASNTIYNIGLDTVLKVIDSNIWYSDHGPFWKYGYPAMFNIEWLNDSYRPKNSNYHTLGDYLDTLKPEFLTKMTQLTLVTIAELAGVLLPQTKVDSYQWQLYP